MKLVVKGMMLIYNSTSSESPSRQRGFSLLEVSLVLFLVAILLGFSLPRFSTLYESTLEQEAKKLAKMIRDQRFKAVLHGETITLIFDTKKETYAVEKKGCKSNKFDKTKPIQLKKGIKFYQISNNASSQKELQFGGPPLIFEKIFGQSFSFTIDSLGFVDQFTIKLRDKTHYISLSVNDIMGHIDIGQRIML